MASSWLIDAVLKAASPRSPAVSEAEDMKTVTSRNRGAATRSMNRRCAVQHAAILARQVSEFGGTSARGRKSQVSSFGKPVATLGQEFRRQAPRTLKILIFSRPFNLCQFASSIPGSHMVHRGPALPNPSLKPSPNGKPPGPVCGALHSPQPGPGSLPRRAA